MSRGILQDFVQDPSGNAVIGASVEVFIADGLYTTQAQLWDAAVGGNSLGNPLTTVERGYFSAFADTAEYDLRVTTTGGSFDIPNVPVFDADELTDLSGSVATAVAAAAASAVSAGESAVSADESEAARDEILALNPLQTVATLAELQGLTGMAVNDVREIAGVGQFQYNGSTWLPISRPITPQMFADNVATGGDDTAAVQAAIDYCAAFNSTLGTSLHCPAGIYLGNFTLKSNVLITGEGQRSTVFKSFLDAPIFKASSTPLQYFGIRDIRLAGNISRPNEIGIDLSSGGPVNYGLISNVYISTTGSYGVRYFGTGWGGGVPHVQHITMISSQIINCQKEGVRIEGANLENRFIGCFITGNGDDGTSDNLSILNGGGADNFPVRTIFTGCVLNGARTIGKAVYITGCENLVFDTCDFEISNYAVYITSNDINRIKNITIRNCSFYWFDGGTYDSGIRIEFANGLRIENNAFKVTGNSTLGSFIVSTAPAAAYRRVVIGDDNTYEVVSGSTITTPFSYGEPSINISASSIRAHTNVLSVDTAASPDTISNIYDSEGGTELLTPNQVVVLKMRNNAKSITINSTGNISLVSPIVFTSNRDSCTLMWSDRDGKWFEVSRQTDTRLNISTAVATTTLATPSRLTFERTGLNYVALANNTAVTATVDVVGRKTDGTEIGAYKISVAARRGASAGTTVVNAATTTTVFEDVAGWDATVLADTTGGGFYIQVTGAAATTINWRAVVTYQSVA